MVSMTLELYLLTCPLGFSTDLSANHLFYHCDVHMKIFVPLNFIKLEPTSKGCDLEKEGTKREDNNNVSVICL